MSATVSEFEKGGKKYPTIGLKADEASKYSFTFGVNKARLILENLDDIKQFVKENRVN